MAKAECQNVCSLVFDQEEEEHVVQHKRKSMFGSSLRIAMNTWSDIILF